MTVRGPTYLIALSTLLIGGSAALAQSSRPPAGAAPKPTSDVRFDEKIGSQVPLDLVLRNENDEPITVGECLDNKPTILVLAYYRCPTLCNEVLNGLVKSMRELPHDFSAGNQFRVLTVSFDPKEHGDLARRKKDSYVREYGRPGADTGWRFCTAGVDSVEALTTAVGYKYEYDRVFKEYNHPSGVIILSPQGKVMRYFYGFSFGGEYQLEGGGSTTLRLSLVEAADGKGGSLLDKITLACFSWDPSTKKYSPSIVKLMRAAGILTVAAVALGVTIAFVRERRRRAAPAFTGQPDSRPTEGTT